MADWNAGAIFGLAWFIFSLPIHIGGTIWFWLRRDVQPIKARSPSLVVVTDIILMLYVGLLCFQRIFADDYPCMLTMWSGHIGTIVLFNTYLWRCWTLYFTFHLTQQKLLQSKAALQAASTDASSSKLPFFIRNRRYVSSLFLFKVTGMIMVILLLPIGLLSATPDGKEIAAEVGDNCDRKWGDTLLAAYVVAYVMVFIGFAFSLRAVVDGFKIKTELKFTSILGLIAVIPWAVFNQLFSDVNKDVFPFSTFCLIMAAEAAFGASTLWPLYRSIFEGQIMAVDVDAPDSLNSLRNVLLSAEGFEAFKKFLTKEFSVENILFWAEVGQYRKAKKELVAKNAPDMDLVLLGKAQALYALYIISQAPFQVNLPDPIVRRIEARLKSEFAHAGKKTAAEPEDLPDPSSPPEVLETPTLFDAAQHNIFRLMETDSFPRFIRTDEYKKLIDDAKSKHATNKVLRDMNLL